MPSHGIGVTSAFLAASVFCLSFGNALQSISALALLQPFLALVTYDRFVLLPPTAWATQNPRLWHATAALIIILAQAVGGTVAFGGNYPFVSRFPMHVYFSSALHMLK